MSQDQNGTFRFQTDYSGAFKWPEYLVFVAVLIASMGIGVFFGFFSKKNKSNEEFLTAGKSMSVLPVTLSLVCSFVSAITLLGNPVEVYFYGLIFLYYSVAFIPMTAALAYLYVPVFFNVNLNSAYEYLELRFNTKIRKIFCAFAVMHMILYMPLSVWGPSLALDQVAGFDKYLSSGVIFIVCIIYSSIGGLKAVLWSDALQAAIMFISAMTIIVLGIINIGGFEELWVHAKNTGRTEMLIFDVDPRTRHTFWTGVIGVYAAWITLFAGTQAQIQRFLAVPTLQQSRKCLLYNLIGMCIVMVLCSIIGLILYAAYYDCDPTSVGNTDNTGREKLLGSVDQLLPFYVMEALSKYQGLPGLLVAGLTCGTLSTVSSSLNALPAVIVEDYIKPWRPDYTDLQLSRLSKVITLVGGLISFALIFIIARAGNILPFAFLIHGGLIGPICATFSLGMFFPFTNSLGCALAIIPSTALTLFVGVGSVLWANDGKLPNQKLHLTTEGCYLNDTSTRGSLMLNFTRAGETHWKDQEYDTLTNIFAISYLWQPLISLFSCALFGFVFSIIINCLREKPSPPVKEKYMTPVIVTLWVKLFGKERMKRWIEFNEEEVEPTKSP